MFSLVKCVCGFVFGFAYWLKYCVGLSLHLESSGDDGPNHREVVGESGGNRPLSQRLREAGDGQGQILTALLVEEEGLLDGLVDCLVSRTPDRPLSGVEVLDELERLWSRVGHLAGHTVDAGEDVVPLQGSKAVVQGKDLRCRRLVGLSTILLLRRV